MRKKVSCILILFILFAFKQNETVVNQLINSAVKQTQTKVTYEPAYVKISYPGGDVPSNTGVCTDLIIRSYRAIGIDLQKEVHEDMLSNFKLYPKMWKLKQPDSNIDHRRVPNLMCFLERKNSKLKITNKREDYKPGDLVTWNLQNKTSVAGITHIGIVTNIKNADQTGYLIAHNIGGGNVLEDMLFNYTIIGHYRYLKY
ncbi:MAG: DUF1287 domain-containing protein [Sphingobacteriaceae bacterium]|nr:DUF1287 domain-containing protein [Sphingobacteriaceae bacterium]